MDISSVLQYSRHTTIELLKVLGVTVDQDEETKSLQLLLYRVRLERLVAGISTTIVVNTLRSLKLKPNSHTDGQGAQLVDYLCRHPEQQLEVTSKILSEGGQGVPNTPMRHSNQPDHGSSGATADDVSGQSQEAELSYLDPLPTNSWAEKRFEEGLRNATDEQVLQVLSAQSLELAAGLTIRQVLRRHVVAANLDPALMDKLSQELSTSITTTGNLQTCRKTYAEAAAPGSAGVSAAGQKTYAQVAASRCGVSGAGDCRRQADTPAVETGPHPEAVARLRSLNLHVLSLANLGQNNCYANTVVTMLANLPQLRSLLEDEREDNLGPVSKELRRLMLLRDGTTESLQTLRSLVADSLRRWPGEEITQDYDASRQHDASEFLSTLIQCLRDELKKRSETESILDLILNGELRVSRKCLRCGHSSLSVEAMNNPMPLELSLDWAEWILEDLVNFAGDSGRKEMEKNCLSCGLLNAPHEEIKEYDRLPTVLFLSLGRFQARFGNEVETVKIKDPVSVLRDVRVRCSEDHFAEYSLVSYNNHIGEEARSGHYTVSLRDPDTKLFAKCDDARGFLQATDTGIGHPSEADEAYIVTLAMKNESEPQLPPPRKRLNSRSHEVYSPVRGGPAGGATPKQHRTPVFSAVGHNRGRGGKDLGHGTGF